MRATGKKSLSMGLSEPSEMDDLQNGLSERWRGNGVVDN
jgi:hypothetical protein